MVIAFIPVRGGSKSIPLKNIKPFCGKPLVCWSIEALEQCNEVDEIIVATDSDKIEEVVSNQLYNKTKVYRRSVENACDTASTESVMLEYANYAQLPSDCVFILVQATSPLTGTQHFAEALAMYRKGEFDLILLDVMLPKLTGFEVCQQVREFSDVPIIMLTAKGDDIDKIMGLEYGADDYVTKPFNILEVKARIKAIIRRTKKDRPEEQKNLIVKGEMKLDCESRRVFIGEREVNLTAKEFDMLELLALNQNKVYSREKLLNLVWGYDYPGDARTVDVHIRRLREKIESHPSDPKYVHTKWGVGYYFRG